MTSLGSVDWISAHRKMKWRLAGKAARSTDLRWTNQMLNFRPSHGQGRRQSRPFKRWTDDIIEIAGGDWAAVSSDENMWAILEAGYVARMN